MDIVVKEKPAELGWQEITAILHQAHATRRAQGLVYKASYQDTAETIKRVGNGICLVAFIDDKPVATTTLKFIERKAWYCGHKSGFATQTAVLPDYMGMGVASKLHKLRMKICQAHGASELIADTSIYADDIISWWLRMGAQIVGWDSFTGTNYYSVIMRIPVGSKRFSNFKCKAMLYLSMLKTILLKNKSGAVRPWAKPLLKLKAAFK